MNNTFIYFFLRKKFNLKPKQHSVDFNFFLDIQKFDPIKTGSLKNIISQPAFCRSIDYVHLFSVVGYQTLELMSGWQWLTSLFFVKKL